MSGGQRHHCLSWGDMVNQQYLSLEPSLLPKMLTFILIICDQVA